MRLKLPSSLHYPLTIRKIEKFVGDDIQQRDTLFTYSYTTKVLQQEKYSDDEVEVDKTFSAHYQSTIEGKITTWLVWEGDTVSRPVEVVDVEEPCKHETQYAGMCVDCGKDMTGIEMSGEDLAGRATIQGAHDTDKLLISQDEANELDQASKKRLLAARKLSLVVDLDQTIIHAAVEPTIGEWMKDPNNPNFEALQDVRPFQLLDDAGSRQECWYYIKLRPGLEEFLESIAEKYELHIYTMGTRQYAQQIADIVDPQRKYFGDRILSRDESGSVHAKNLTRLFPVDTRMVVIIDDRADVWKWSPNLIRVTAFNFFTGTGDINAGFLPKLQDVQVTEKLETPSKSEPNGDASTDNNPTETAVNGEAIESPAPGPDTTALQQVVAMAKVEEPASVAQDAVIAQLEEKPLLRLQKQMDEKDGVDAGTVEPTNTQATESDSSDSETSSNSGKKRHSVLRNDDEELIHLERTLRTVHDRYFNDLDRRQNPSSGKGGRVAALAGKEKAPIPDKQTDVKNLPDVKQIITNMKHRVLAGVVIVFSSVVPLKSDVQNADVSLWAKSFGAVVQEKITRDTTHLVAAKEGTAKVKTAVKRGIKVVNTEWLLQSVQRWKKLDERPFMYKNIGQAELPKLPSSDDVAHDQDILADLALPEGELSSEEDASALNDTDDNEDDSFRRKRPRLDLQDIPQPTPEQQQLLPPSPTDLSAEQWSAMDDEIREAMGSDLDSESDVESVRSDHSLSMRTKKRSRDDLEEAEDNSASDSEQRNGDGHLSKRPRNSALRQVKNAESTGSNTPRTAMDEDESDFDADLAAELERELEAADN